MANKVIVHCSNYGCEPPIPQEPSEPDKSKSISQMSRKELWEMLSRLRDETEIHRIIRELKRNSGERDTFEEPFKLDTQTPINQMYHSGVKGMKWGLRRFQNRDGTRTPAGKKQDLARNRHGITKEKPKSEDHVKSRQAKSKGPDGLTNEQLKKLNERLQLEETYRKLTAEDRAKSESWVKKTLADSAKAALADYSKNAMLGSAKILTKQISPQFYEAAFGKK